MPTPTTQPAAPSSSPWIRKMRRICRRVVPTARRMPISRFFCTTQTTSTLAMPSATATTTNAWIM